MKRCAQFLVLIATVVGLSGCPSSGSPYVGTWIVSIDGLDRGLTVNADGTASAFMVDTNFAGTLTWIADGDQFIMNQDTGNSRLIYSSQFVGNNDTMTGAFVVWAGQGFQQSNQWNAARQ